MAGVVCIGAASVDRKYRLEAPVHLGSSNPARTHRTFGGVARNVAENLCRLGSNVTLISVVGDDDDGDAIVSHAQALGIDVRRVRVSRTHPTGDYVAVLGTAGELVLGISAMDVLEELGPDDVEAVRGSSAGWLFADCNLGAATLRALCALSERPRLAVDAVSVAKVARLPESLRGIDLLFLNQDEARAYLGPAAPDSAAALASELRARGCGAVVLTAGGAGLTIAAPEGTLAHGAVACRPVDVTGAGDALIAGTLHRLGQGDPLASAVLAGMRLAALTVESPLTVRPDLRSASLA